MSKVEKNNRVRKKMKENEASALVMLSVENVTHFIGTMIPSHETSPKRRVIVIVPEEKEPILIIAGREEDFAEKHSNIKDIRIYQEYKEDPIDFLISVLDDLNLSGEKIALEMEGINARDFLKLQEYAKRIRFEIMDASPLLEEIRLIKTPEEIELLKKICRISEETIIEVFSSLKPGMMEKEVETLFISTLSSKGGTLKKGRFGSGENTGVGNPEAGERKLEKGDLFRTDFMGTTISHYYSDIARTGVLGKPRTEFLDIWSKIYETHMKILDKIRPGILSSELYKFYKKEFEKWGFPPVPMVGHGIGLALTESPVLNAYNQMALTKGMVLCIEEDYIVKGKMGLHLEDTILVTDTGYKLFSDIMDTSSLFIIE